MGGEEIGRLRGAARVSGVDAWGGVGEKGGIGAGRVAGPEQEIRHMKRQLMAAVVGLAAMGWVGAGVSWGQQEGAQQQQAKPVKKAKAPAAPRTPESAVTPAPHSPQRHEGFMKEKEGKEFDLVFIGDSITDFWPKRGPETWAKFGAYRPLDLGVSGDRTEHVLWRFAHNELDGLHPKATVIMIGTNNIGQCPDEKPEWAAKGVKEILDEVHQKMPGTKVLLLAVFPRDAKGSEKREKVEEINKIISKYGGEKDTTYLDIGKVFLDENGEIPADVMPDKLHPNAKGYQLWYDAMWPTLEKLLK
jgi:lysophospholipase L1-like esterase